MERHVSLRDAAHPMLVSDTTSVSGSADWIYSLNQSQGACQASRMGRTWLGFLALLRQFTQERECWFEDVW